MLQIKLPFQHPLPQMANYPIRAKLLSLLKGELDFHGYQKSNPIHTWHAFPAKFPPQLARKFINELTFPEDIVLDPMMGSSTTVVEALLAGRKAVGTDIDPLSIRLATAKMSVSEMTNARMMGNEIIIKAQKYVKSKTKLMKERLNTCFDTKTKAFIDYWFAFDTQLELLALISAIQRIDDQAHRAFFTLLFSSIIITKSGGVSMARDLAHTRPHRVGDKIPKPAIDEFSKRLDKIFKNVSFQSQTASMILAADAQSLPLSDNCIDLIITSPPYASNAIDYMRAHKFTLVWLGYSVSSLSKVRRQYIGGEAISRFDLTPLPKKVMLIIEKLRERDQKKGKILHRYYTEISHAFSEMYRVLKPNHATIVVVGNSRIREMDINIESCFRNIGENTGFEHIYSGIRRLDRNKRMMPARWNRNKNTGIEARMHEEYVIGFLKPKI